MLLQAHSGGGLAPSTLAQWFAAVGTIGAVLVALFKDLILAWRRRPKLEVTCTKEVPWTVRTPIIVYTGQGVILWSGECYFVRIKVKNIGKTRAEKVQVSASKLEKQGLDGKFTEIPTILPLNMKWSNSPPNTPVVILDGLSSEMTAFCDIVSLCDPANPHQRKPAATPPNITVGQLQLEVDPPGDLHLLSPGTYKLTLRLAAANVTPIDKELEFSHKGTWLANDAEMRRDCLAVSLK